MSKKSESESEVRERKKTAVHGTLGLALMAWKFNSKQLLSKTLNSRINIIETRAVLKIVKKDKKYALDKISKFSLPQERLCGESGGWY